MAAPRDPGLHEGHRQRMKERFEKNGFTGFSQHEILEMILYYVYPRIDTNEIAHNLIERFGSLAGVMDAPVERLMTFGGISYNAAVLLKIIPASMRVYSSTHLVTEAFDTVEKMKSLFIACYTGVTNEEFRLVCFDNDLRIISNTVINQGTPSVAPVNMHRLLETVFESRSTFTAIAHNHPGGTSEPSDRDIYATRQIISLFRPVGITLIDHIIVGADGAFSMRDSTALNIFDR